jgi:hypothetical protein
LAGFAGRYRRSTFTSIEERRPRIEAQSAGLLLGAMTFDAVSNEQRANVFLEVLVRASMGERKSSRKDGDAPSHRVNLKKRKTRKQLYRNPK